MVWALPLLHAGPLLGVFGPLARLGPRAIACDESRPLIISKFILGPILSEIYRYRQQHTNIHDPTTAYLAVRLHPCPLVIMRQRRR